MQKLEIGPGKNPVGTAEEGWVFLGADARWGEKPLPFPDGSCAEVYASHVLEHIPWTQTQSALKEVLRILEPGGKFEVWVPNFEYIAECYRKKMCGDKWRRENPEGDFMTWVNGRLFTYGPEEDNWHRACFDAESLCRHLTEAGFRDVKRLAARTRGVSHGPIDLGATGVRG